MDYAYCIRGSFMAIKQLCIGSDWKMVAAKGLNVFINTYENF